MHSYLTRYLMMSCNLLILEEHLEVDTCQGSQRIKYEELILLNNIFHSAKNKIVQNYRSFSSWRHFFTYQSVTTSWEYVWLGTDLARAKPRNNQPRLDIDKQISLENKRNAKWSYWWGGVGWGKTLQGRGGCKGPWEQSEMTMSLTKISQF